MGPFQSWTTPAVKEPECYVNPAQIKKFKYLAITESK